MRLDFTYHGDTKVTEHCIRGYGPLKAQRTFLSKMTITVLVPFRHDNNYSQVYITFF